MFTQAYFEFDTKKSFGVTKSHLRFGKNPIKSTHLIKSADFVACHNQTYLPKYDIIEELRPGGVFLLNCTWQANELDQNIPAHIKRYIANNDIKFYIINANEISNKLGLGNLSNGVLQAAFFSLANIIPVDDAVKYMKDAIEKTYGKKGGEIVDQNSAAVDGGVANVHFIEVPAAWKNAVDTEAPAETEQVPSFIKNILRPINAQKGDNLPVSAFIGNEDGTMPMGTSAYEKRGIATTVPVWDSEKCIQCNMCAYVCPHAVIRPFLLDEAEAKNAPEGFLMTATKGTKAAAYQYSLQVSQLDCSSCGCCVASCLAKDKAIKMESIHAVPDNSKLWNYAMTITDKPGVFSTGTIKGSQFVQPLLEFSGACAGCGETPYAKLLTQLFGDRIYWANATGCSQAWGASMPCIPYTVNKKGQGPAWSNSLFENNAEFSLGMALSVKQQRALLYENAEKLRDLTPALQDPIDAWLKSFNSSVESAEASAQLLIALGNATLNGEAAELRDAIVTRKDQLTKKSIWMYGGDGWAYDIGYGGLDHVFAQGEDVNVFVIDTEVYSNTGGQSSKATPRGASAQFASSGKKSGKKDLGAQMMAYGNVYVAQVAMGADPTQLIKALIEADNHPGPSIVIGFTPCIAHGIKIGMGEIQEEMKRAVQAGYWHLYRYNPENKEQPFSLDSKEPTMPFHDFLRGELRYSLLETTFPENAKYLFGLAEVEAKEKYENYKRMAGK
jgi:pyruvate-ferredoxin/flavodoxin oxidoreductase